MKTTETAPQKQTFLYFLEEQSTREEVAESLEALIYGFVFYAAETGMNSQEILKHYDTGRTLINLVTKQAA
jgi:hypothetical protein